MTINEINTTLSLNLNIKSPLSVCCNNFWLQLNVDFGQMMRQNILLVRMAWKKSNVTSSVTKYCC